MVISAPLASLATPAFAQTNAAQTQGSQRSPYAEPTGGARLEASSNGSRVSEDPSPNPTSSEPSEATKQAAEKAREAAKQAAEKTREAAKQAAKQAREAAKKAKNVGESNLGSGQLQLPPLVIRPATPGDNVSSDSGDDSSANNKSGTPLALPTASSSATPDPNSTTSVAAAGKRKFAAKPGTAQTSQTGQDSQTSASGDRSTASNSALGKNQVTYVVSPLSNGQSASIGSTQTQYVKIADPNSNDPIRVVSAASLKTPADQFFELAGYGMLALGVGTAAMVGFGVYRGIRLRRSEAFDFEYRS